ncbi:SRPBCC family protein [Qaidamihabitans albus]|uniref:SRPBCC family protein n=1 Tax=Qaidamihabitans albus TaxID=2795733 RepID=UPI0018F1B7F1|nr:SRPBCC family protein [Qaidamihabitans albus]
MVHNLHVRRLPGSEAGSLIDTLAGPEDRLWPAGSWPPMRFDRPLATGATGGHGPVRYRVESYTPGRSIRFRFSAPRGFDGFHEFSTATPGPEATELRHVLVLRSRFPAWITYPLFWRPLHDALIEDCLDQAERAVTGGVRAPARWPPYVRLLRGLIGRRASPSRR